MIEICTDCPFRPVDPDTGQKAAGEISLAQKRNGNIFFISVEQPDLFSGPFRNAGLDTLTDQAKSCSTSDAVVSYEGSSMYTNPISRYIAKKNRLRQATQTSLQRNCLSEMVYFGDSMTSNERLESLHDDARL